MIYIMKCVLLQMKYMLTTIAHHIGFKKCLVIGWYINSMWCLEHAIMGKCYMNIMPLRQDNKIPRINCLQGKIIEFQEINCFLGGKMRF
jgi:hypothetical protein